MNKSTPKKTTRKTRKKTSFSIDESLLEKAKEIARSNERSVSWLLNKLASVGLKAAQESENLGEAFQKYADRLKNKNGNRNP